MVSEISSAEVSRCQRRFWALGAACQWLDCLTSIGATWDPVNASPPTMGTKHVWSSPTFVVMFFWLSLTWLSRFSLATGKLLDLMSKGMKIATDLGQIIAGDWEGRKENREKNQYPPHVWSPPSFQLWLHLCSQGMTSVSLLYWL